jgi:hypothetical protein
MNVKDAYTNQGIQVGKTWAVEIMRIKETERENLTEQIM